MSKSEEYMFDGDKLEALDAIRVATKSKTNAEAIRKGLNLLSVLTAAQDNGSSILIKDKEGHVKKIVMD